MDSIIQWRCCQCVYPCLLYTSMAKNTNYHRADVTLLQSENARLKEENAALAAQVKELKRKLEDVYKRQVWNTEKESTAKTTARAVMPPII